MNTSDGRMFPSTMGTYFIKEEYVYQRTKTFGAKILYECHDSPSAGHPSIRKTYALVRRQFYWPGLHNEVQEYVTHCSKCQVNKAERLKACGLLHPLEIPQVGISTEKLQHVKDFLQDHMDMLKLTRQNVCQAQDRYKKYAHEKRRQVVFKEGDYVFLRIPEHSESLKIGPTPKLSPRFCGPFKILRRVGSMAYKLELPANSHVHPIFHVSRLRQRLLREDNIIDQEVLVDFLEPPNLPHEPERILDSHDLRTRRHVRHQVLVKWKDRPEEGATWEIVSTLRKRFPSFVFKDENASPRGGNVKTRVLA
ncbi:hypothetical protein L7F22_012300 [Adiantum nelumboides]|nr:hypothetical protein [Adiantum nelumboides]